MGDLISTFLFQPPCPATPIRLRPASSCSDMELVWLTTLKGSTIPALYLHRKYATYTILYSHGNAEDLGMVCDYLLDLSKILHVNILAYDYTGYGFSNRDSTAPVSTPSPIPPSEDHFYSDITAAYRYLTKDRGLTPASIILYGRSIGSGPSCYLASRLNKQRSGGNSNSNNSKYLSRQSSSISCPSAFTGDTTYGLYEDNERLCGSVCSASQDNAPDESYFGGLILHSPFASIYRIVFDFGFTFQYDQFPNIDRIGDVCCPVLLVHGTKDEIVPFSHGQALYDLVPKRHKVFQPFWAQKMGHNNIEVDATNAFVRYLMEFLQTVRQRQTTGQDFRGPSRAQDEEIDLTKSFVQSHVVVMMDKKKRQHPGFVRKNSGRSVASSTHNPGSRTDSSRKSAASSRHSISNVKSDDELTEFDNVDFGTKSEKGQSNIGLSAVHQNARTRRSTKQSEKFRDQLLIPEIRSPAAAERR